MDMTEQRILIRGGTVIDVESGAAQPSTDVLIEGEHIAAVGPDLDAAGAEIIDATDRIVVPGFVDVHRHAWQAALRATAVDVDLQTYLERILGQFGPRFAAEHIGTATLAGALECLDAGVTTLMDFSHALHSPAHADAAVDALDDSGIRAVFGYGFAMYGERDFADVRRVRTSLLANDAARVTMALAPVGPSFTPIDVVREDWALADELGLRLTFHVSASPVAERPVTTLREHGLLRAGSLYIHGGSLDDDELALIGSSGGYAGSTPAAEAQLTGGTPVIGRLRRAGVLTGLGVDAVTSVPGDMFSTMRAALVGSQIADKEPLTAVDVLRMATLDGATALGLGDRTGSLTPGKQADVVLLRTDDLNLLTADHDAADAVVASAHGGNVDTVLVAGQVVKTGGRLARTDLDAVTAAVREVAATVRD
jgi:cytosine/adenosine deaminase-related metal-dependent hydrolase